jgi:hypothetical protein
MDEKTAKQLGITIVRREMAFASEYVTCTNCACNYHAKDMTPTFCQMYSRSVDPSAIALNEVTAAQCMQWVPNGLDRNKVINANHSYRYEKD